MAHWCKQISISSICPKAPITYKKTSFLRLSKLKKYKWTGVNNHFGKKRNEKNNVSLLPRTI
jgi:hypothetical protein